MKIELIKCIATCRNRPAGTQTAEGFQTRLSSFADVGVRFVRDPEDGKETVQLNSAA